VSEPASDSWRLTVRRRLVVRGGAARGWATGIEARLFYLQVHKHADLEARAERPGEPDAGDLRKARRHSGQARPRAGLQRGQRLGLRGAQGNRGSRRRWRQLCEALATARPRSGRTWPRSSAMGALLRPCAAGLGRSRRAGVADLQLTAWACSRKIAGSIPTERWPHSCWDLSGGQQGLGGIEAAYDSQIRGDSGEAAGPDRRRGVPSAAWSVRRRRAPAWSSPSTSTSSTWPSVSCTTA
jgi:hypothetical protein